MNTFFRSSSPSFISCIGMRASFGTCAMPVSAAVWRFSRRSAPSM